MTDVMPGPNRRPTSMWAATPEPDRVNREAPFMEASRGLALREAFEDSQISRYWGFIAADDARARQRQHDRFSGTDSRLSAEEANDRYGVPGRLTFDGPISEPIAAWQNSLRRREAFRDEVIANADVSPLQLIGAGFAGAIFDPVGLPLWLVPELAAGRFLRSAAMTTQLARLGPVARGAVVGGAEGVAGGLVYEGVNLWMHNEANEDYSFGQASANVLFGGLLGAGIGGAGGWWQGRTAGRAPEAVRTLDDGARVGALAEALEAVIEDRPVDLGPMLAREAEARAAGRVRGARALDEGPLGAVEETPTLAMRTLEPDVAVTPRGTEVPVRYALVEVDDLVTSHDDDLFRNPEYPGELQPRQRDRAGAQARNRALEAELNPKRLMNDVGAETGAPIIARDGTVESGNGRTIAIRRSYRNGSGAAERYRAELEARGFDVAGMDQPVLVRVRTDALDGEARVRLTREMNAEATEAYSPSERAVADAEAVDDALLVLVDGPDMNGAGNRRFVRAFLDKVASDDLNRMTTQDGRLSDAGLDRINAAMVARAFGDRQLVEALFEATDSNIKTIGKALAEAAPEWAAMRAAVARGETPAALDPTEALTAAVAFVRHVRQRGANLAETMELTIGQFDAFAGSAMTPETEAFVRSFFRTSKEGVTLWKSPRSASGLAEGLRWLAGEVRKAEPGPNLFGEVADAATGRTLLEGLGRWFARSGDEGEPFLDFGPDPTDVPAAPAGGDVRPAGDDGGRVVGGSDAGGRPESDGQPGDRVEKPRVAKGEAPKPPKGQPFADPEVAALLRDTDQALLRAGIDPAQVAAAAPDGQDPQTIADAVAAAAYCLKGSAE